MREKRGAVSHYKTILKEEEAEEREGVRERLYRRVTPQGREGRML